MAMDQETQRSQLKKLIIQGKEKGFLTYGEINDHLPEDIHDTDQIEAVVSMINDMGIQVYDEAPDPETLLLKSEPPPAEDEDEAAEEAEQVAVSAVESDFGRTTDPVRMYMREMGTVELLTREGEIELAKRIEDGVRQTTEAIAACPAAIDEVVRMMDLVEADQMRLTDLVVDFVDPDAEDMPLPEVTPKTAATAEKDEDEESDAGNGGGGDEEEGGPDREEAMIRFTRIRRLHENLAKTIDKKNYDAPEVKRLQKKLADEFMQIKFVSKQVNRLVEHVRALVEQAREQEKVIMDVCVGKARMPRKTFLKLFPGNETIARATGLLGGRAVLEGRGNSLAQVLADADGTLGLAMSGGQVSNLVIELAGLDAAEALRLLFQGDRPVALRCAVADVGVRKGVIEARSVVVDTTDTHIKVDGSIDLASEQLDLTLHPLPKDYSLLSLRSPIHVRGTFKDPAIRLDDQLALRGGVAAVLGTVAAPAAALAALIESGPGDDADCEHLIAAVERHAGRDVPEAGSP